MAGHQRNNGTSATAVRSARNTAINYIGGAVENRARSKRINATVANRAGNKVTSRTNSINGTAGNSASNSPDNRISAMVASHTSNIATRLTGRVTRVPQASRCCGAVDIQAKTPNRAAETKVAPLTSERFALDLQSSKSKLLRWADCEKRLRAAINLCKR